MNPFELFFTGYCEALRWADLNDEPIPSHVRPKLKALCRSFWEESRVLIDAEPNQGHYSAGIDFYLTQNGHGAGFWDGDWHEHGDALTRRAEDHGHVCAFADEEGPFVDVTLPAHVRSPENA